MRPLEPVVLDASAVIELILGTPAGERVAAFVRGHVLTAPSLLDAEVLSALRGLERGQRISSAQADASRHALERSAIELHSIRPLLGPAWRLRHRLSTYDAMYVALAASIGAPVVTLDARWQRAGDLGVPVVTLS